MCRPQKEGDGVRGEREEVRGRRRGEAYPYTPKAVNAGQLSLLFLATTL